MATLLPKFSGTIDVDLMTVIHSKTRNLIRKAQKSDISFWHDSNGDNLHFLAQLHRKNMEAIGVPPKDEDFFDTLVRIFTYNEDYRVYIAEKDGIKIAALLITYFNKTVSYFTPAVDADYREYQPLNLLIYNAMKDAAQMGYHYWNWGGTAHSAEGVYHFKKRWGSQECQYYYYTRSYRDISDILSLSEKSLLSEFPFFYVIPFSQLNENSK
jgi:lipid II:glycine glycyltransferase (peptidoglycan interpeptide bridge formation enzyme)